MKKDKDAETTEGTEDELKDEELAQASGGAQTVHLTLEIDGNDLEPARQVIRHRGGRSSLGGA